VGDGSRPIIVSARLPQVLDSSLCDVCLGLSGQRWICAWHG